MWKFWRTSDPGLLRDVGLVCLADGIVGVSFGATAVAGGLPWWVPVAMSLLVFAGGAQFAAVGVVLAGGSPFAAVAAGALLNTRLFPYGLAVADVSGPSGSAGPGRARAVVSASLGAHVVTDESVAFALRQRRPGPAPGGVLGVRRGAVRRLEHRGAARRAGGRGGEEHGAFGLDAAFPAVLLALALPALADRRTRVSAADCGAATAVALTPFLPAGLPVLAGLAGLAAGWRPQAEATRSAAVSARAEGAGPGDIAVSERRFVRETLMPLLAIVVLAAMTYAFRVAGPLLRGRVTLPPAAERLFATRPRCCSSPWRRRPRSPPGTTSRARRGPAGCWSPASSPPAAPRFPSWCWPPQRHRAAAAGRSAGNCPERVVAARNGAEIRTNRTSLPVRPRKSAFHGGTRVAQDERRRGPLRRR